MNNFYVYAHKRETDGAIYYIGKGRRRRAWAKDNRNKFWHHTFQKHGLIVEILRSNLSESCAMSFERIMIAAHKSPKLVNLTNGGEGLSGYVWSREARERMAVTLGRPVFNSDGEVFPSQKHAARAMRSRGYPTASHAGIYSVTSGKASSAYGHAWSHHGVPAKPKKIGLARARPIICVETGAAFESAAAAARWLNRGNSRNWITACCRGRAKSAYGYKWKYQTEKSNA